MTEPTGHKWLAHKYNTTPCLKCVKCGYVAFVNGPTSDYEIPWIGPTNESCLLTCEEYVIARVLDE